jgi:branched-chain amino acid transport system ATP-binding protein
VSALLAADALELAYGDTPACRDLSFHIEEGEIVALIGANGAGKSTTLRAVAGVLRPRAGTIRFRGRDITLLPSHRRVGLGIALVPEGRHVFPFLTVRENLELGAFKSRRNKPKLRDLMERAFAMFPRLAERALQKAGTLSGGEQQMLVLGRAMMSEPALLCLDEPSLGLAPQIVHDIFRTIRTINAGGTSVLLVEQNARYALETASRGYVLQTGAIVAGGPCAVLREDERVRHAYLGGGASKAKRA